VDGLEFWNQASFLKAGINGSDLVTTVSEGYAREILTADYGYGFDGIMQARQSSLRGILNGIDPVEWDPGHDRFLPAPFSADDLTGKVEAKRRLLERFGLPVTETGLRRPVVGMISRLVYQKGFDLIAEVIDELAGLGATFIVLGSGEPEYERMWQEAAVRHRDTVGVSIGYDEGLAHLIEGGADLFLMPSRYEPCGLNQMYSMRYGTVPVVRATGGLDDAVDAYDPRSGAGTGFKFTAYESGAMLEALRSALEVYDDPERWRACGGTIRGPRRPKRMSPSIQR
jgi:starch synthase